MIKYSFANYTIDQPGRFLFGKFQEEATASPCLLLARPMRRTME